MVHLVIDSKLVETKQLKDIDILYLFLQGSQYVFAFTSDPAFQKNSFTCFNEGSLKIMTINFYFILKAFFVLKMFKFLS